jgi:hypothetical protein
MPDDARSPKTKKLLGKSPNILAWSERTVRNHMAEERDTYEARADYRAQSGWDHASAREIMG